MGVERARVVVIGGGVVGCSILWELARRGLPGLLLEAEPDICEGTSKANSGIVHTGFDARPGSLEAQMLQAARPMWSPLIDELGVPFLNVGAIMVARSDDEAARLKSEIAVNAKTMGVNVELIDRAAVRSVSPYLSLDVVSALSIPDESVVDPFWLTRAFAEAALAGGGEVRLRQRVEGMRVDADSITLSLSGGHRVVAEHVIDAAGLRADEIARMADDRSFSIRPRKGQFLVSEETFGVDRIVLPIPGRAGKGMLVTPIVFGGLLLGPTAVDGADKQDDTVDPDARREILSRSQELVPEIAGAVPVRQFAGLRHVSSTGDFIIRPSAKTDRLYLVAGIRSTGISTSPAIAQTVVSDIASLRGWTLRERPRSLSPAPITVADNPGQVVCVCRSVSRGEIETAARRPTDPATLDALKRRSGAMFGDCQGNMCAVEIAEIVAAERSLPVTAIEQHRQGSWLWTRRTRYGASAHPRPSINEDLPGTCDVVVVGGGRAGRAAAQALGDGVVTLTIERSTGTSVGTGSIDGRSQVMTGLTVVGLTQDPNGWVVLTQSVHRTDEVTARMVILATGAYDRPPEHHGIVGSRPSGLMTADRAWRSLAAGLLPGTSIALVGTGERVERLAAELVASGADVRRLSEAPVEVRGRGRLEAVRLDTGWVEVDTLILADALLAQTFLLRGLGLVDGVPGRPAPVDNDGRTALPGLWAAGCCVQPDGAHAACDAQGGAVGRRVAEMLKSTSGVPMVNRRP